MTKIGRPVIIHAVAQCCDCEWEETDYRLAVKEARKHWKKTGHEVMVETGYNQRYPRKAQN